MFKDFATVATEWAAHIPFDTVVWLVWGSFGGIFLIALVLTLAVPAVRSASKRPFLCLNYAYTALTFAAFLLVNDLQSSAFVAAVFWIAGYSAYGLLCALTKKKRAVISAPVYTAVQTAAKSNPAPREKLPQSKGVAGAVANNNVRLEHAIAVTDKLLEKNLGKTDRGELEKLKNTLEVMKIKGTLSPAEGEILNENFNTLLKLMAKYNV